MTDALTTSDLIEPAREYVRTHAPSASADAQDRAAQTIAEVMRRTVALAEREAARG